MVALKQVIFLFGAVFITVLVSWSILYPVLFKQFSNESQIDPHIKRLVELGYLDEYEIKKGDEEKINVTLIHGNDSYGGVTTWCIDQEVYFMDLKGNLLKTINDEYISDCILPEYINKDKIYLLQKNSILEFGLDSSIKNLRSDKFHHDMDLDDEGNIYALAHRNKTIYESGDEVQLSYDVIAIISPSGELIREIDLHKASDRNEKIKLAVKQNPVRYYTNGHDDLDLYHTNTLELITQDIDLGGGLTAKKGFILTCFRNQDMILILDPVKEEFIWFWGIGMLDQPHQPTLLKNGNILIFDNGDERMYSRVIEIVPSTEDIVWEYQGDPRDSFFSKEAGGAERLPNGNTLITEATKGHVFEVNMEGITVWDYWNPNIDEKTNTRKVFYRLHRIIGDDLGLELSKAPTSSVQVKSCEDVDPGQKDDCYAARARINLDFQDCEKIKNQEKGKICMGDVAKTSLNSNICQRISDMYVREECIVEVAKVRNRYSVCDELSIAEVKDYCFLALGKKIVNSSLCEKITDLNDRDGCFWQVARRADDISYCKAIVNDDKRTKCMHDIKILGGGG